MNGKISNKRRTENDPHTQSSIYHIDHILIGTDNYMRITDSTEIFQASYIYYHKTI